MSAAAEELKAFHHHEMIIFKNRVAMMMRLDNQCQVCSVEGLSLLLTWLLSTVKVKIKIKNQKQKQIKIIKIKTKPKLKHQNPITSKPKLESNPRIKIKNQKSNLTNQKQNQ